MIKNIFRRRPFLVTRWRLWLSPQVSIRRHQVRFIKAVESLPDGRCRVQIVDEQDREYWVRLTDKQLRRISGW